MSSGQKAWEEEQEAAAYSEHKNRLSEISLDELKDIVDQLYGNFWGLKTLLTSLPRNGWVCVDRIDELLRKLK